MDEFLREINTSLFKKWLLYQKSNEYTIRLNENDDNIIIIETKYSYSEITFNQMNIIEFCVTNLTNNNIEFYLHFQMNTLKHALELFDEMLETIKKLVNKPSIKILLSCTGGLTTGFFAGKLNEAAKLLNLNYEFSAVPYNELFETGIQYNMVLLAPQISYMHAKVEAALKNKIILKIPPQIFAKYDAGKMISLIQEEYHSIKHPEKLQQPLSLKQTVHNNEKILVIAMIRINERVYLDYRIYGENNKILLDNEVIKHKISLNDLYDILDTALATYNDIKIVGISMPGVINNGHLSLSPYGFNDCDIIWHLSKRYSQKFILSNDVNCIAAGYYVTQDKYSSLSFLFIPLMGHPGGVGSIYNGQLIIGRMHIAGEIRYLPLKQIDFSADNSKILDASIEVAAQTITSVISILDPEAIILSSHFIYETDKLIEQIKTYIPEKYIPPIILIDNLKEYILLGQMILCLKS